MPQDRQAQILLVEDDPLCSLLLHDLIEMSGHRVVCALSLAAARSALASGAFDLVLLDVKLSDGCGTDLLSEIRSDPELAHLPVVVVTAAAMDEDRRMLFDAGCDGYITKPIDTRQFSRQVLSYLRDPRQSVA